MCKESSKNNLVQQGASPHPVGSPVFGERRSGRAQRNPTTRPGSKDSLLLGFAALYPTYNRDLPTGCKFTPTGLGYFLMIPKHGAIMAAGVLNSLRAIEVSVFVVRAFAQLRATLAQHKEIARKIERSGWWEFQQAGYNPTQTYRNQLKSDL